MTPLNDPLSPDEQVACTHLIKHAMQGGNQLVLKTGGQVRYTHCKNIPVTCKCTKPHTCKYNVHVHVLKFSQSLLLQHTPVPQVLSSEAFTSHCSRLSATNWIYTLPGGQEV